MPETEEQMRNCIEIAFQARTKLADNIVNPNERMLYNQTCLACGYNHGA